MAANAARRGARALRPPATTTTPQVAVYRAALPQHQLSARRTHRTHRASPNIPSVAWHTKHFPHAKHRPARQAAPSPAGAPHTQDTPRVNPHTKRHHSLQARPAQPNRPTRETHRGTIQIPNIARYTEGQTHQAPDRPRARTTTSAARQTKRRLTHPARPTLERPTPSPAPTPIRYQRKVSKTSHAD